MYNQVLDKLKIVDNLFNAADDLNDDMIYGDFCQALVPDIPEDGVRCHNCKFYKSRKDGCMLSNALSILDDAKNAYKILKNN